MKYRIVETGLCKNSNSPTWTRLSDGLHKNSEASGLSSGLFPFTAGKPRLDLLEQPVVAVRVLEPRDASTAGPGGDPPGIVVELVVADDLDAGRLSRERDQIDPVIREIEKGEPHDTPARAG